MDPAFGIHFTQFGVVSAAGLLPQNYLHQQHQQQIQVQLISQQVAASTTFHLKFLLGCFYYNVTSAIPQL